MERKPSGNPPRQSALALLANIYLNRLDRVWTARCGHLGILIRRIGVLMNRHGLTPPAAKTRLLDLRRGKDSFVFLGCTIRKGRSIQRNLGWHFMPRWPSPKATKKLQERIPEITSKRQRGKAAKQIIADLTPVLRGWGN